MIFFNTSMFAEFAFTYLQAAGCTNVEMIQMVLEHGHAPHQDGQRRGEPFREGVCVVHGLLPVDVQRDGEGMDFPSVTTVIQVGASPPSCTRSASAALAEG
jgi:hypothetical protein